MKLLMDADCLLKLTKAGLKDFVGNRDTIFYMDLSCNGKTLLKTL